MDKTKINDLLICELYTSGKSMCAIEKETGTSRKNIREILKNNGICIRPIGVYSAKYFPDDYDINCPIELTRKKCSQCKTDKNLTEFHKSLGYPLGVKNKCKCCINAIRKVEWKSQSVRWKEKYNNDDTFKKSILKRNSERRDSEEYKKWNRDYSNNKRKTDLQYKIKSNLSRRLRMALLESGTRKGCAFKKYVGCAYSTLISHIESTWKPNMSWDNYGLGDGKWVIDHIIPCRSFDLVDQKEQMKCFNYTNLQALWCKENGRKGCVLPNGTDARTVYPR